MGVFEQQKGCKGDAIQFDRTMATVPVFLNLGPKHIFAFLDAEDRGAKDPFTPAWLKPRMWGLSGGWIAR